MSHARRTARYVALLRADPRRPAPSLPAATPAAVAVWKKRTRAFDDARLRLNLATPAQIQHANSALRLAPLSSRISAFARHA